MSGQEVAASQQLAEIERARRAVSARAAKESIPFFIWGLFNTLMIPPFDLLRESVWGPVVLVVAVVGLVATLTYIIRGRQRVRIADATPPWTWPVWIIWSNALLAGALLLREDVPVACTIAGLGAGLPLLLVGTRLRGRAA